MVVEKLRQVQARMEQAAARRGRAVSEVTLVAVSKGHPIDMIQALYEAGQRDFGENRATELAEKAPALPDDIRWHFIGSLQTRQAKIARPHTTLLHSLDRLRLVRAWAVVTPAPPVLIEVNIAGESQKHGVSLNETPALLAAAIDAGLQCRGLMTIPPVVDVAEDSRRWFRGLYDLRTRLQGSYPDLKELSMGMTDDFEVAIEEGATIIRVGRAIFGEPGAPALSD